MKALVALAVLLAIGMVGILLYHQQPAEDTTAFDPQASYPLERVVKYSFSVNNPSNRLLKQTGFWTYAPVRQTEHQWVQDIHANVPYTVQHDDVGNQRLQFTLDTLAPFASKIVDVTVQLRLSKDAVEQPNPQNKGNNLDAQRFIELSDPALQAQAGKLIAASPTDTARKTFDWVRSAVKNTGYIDKDRGAAYALATGTGDCSEHMYLNTALNRINGIPARGIAGFVIEHDGVLKPSALHNWSQVQLEQSWQVVDTDLGHFVPDPSTYLAMRILDSQSPFYGDGSQQLFGYPSDIAVRMN